MTGAEAQQSHRCRRTCREAEMANGDMASPTRHVARKRDS